MDNYIHNTLQLMQNSCRLFPFSAFNAELILGLLFQINNNGRSDEELI